MAITASSSKDEPLRLSTCGNRSWISKHTSTDSQSNGAINRYTALYDSDLYYDDLEQYETDDQLGEIPQTFSKHHQRQRYGEYTTHSDDVLNDDDSDDESATKGVRKYAKLILPHVGLVLLTCAYTIIGASIFYSIEQPHEISTKKQQLEQIYQKHEEFVNSLIKLSLKNETRREVWSELAMDHMHNLSDHLFTAFEHFFLTAAEVRRNDTIEIWSFSTSIFFAVTVVTTIGYGSPVPVTRLGRIMCIVFSLFGIPLTLVTIADIGKFLSEHLVWLYGNYLKFKSLLKRKHTKKERRERICEDCRSRGLSNNMQIVEEQRIPAMLVFAILVLYTALGGVLMSHLEQPWDFFTSFYWSFITMTTVGFGDLMPRRDEYMYVILLYIILGKLDLSCKVITGLAITTMCIDLVGVQYIRKIHYFGRKIQNARSALAVVGGKVRLITYLLTYILKVVLVSELYANLMQKRIKNSAKEAFIIDNLYISKHVIPFIPSDIRWIRYIDQAAESYSTTSSPDMHSCRFCHSRFSITHKR
uniref:Ion_trans_2 domain-containing protein n=1 Tax=Syphacia muris TaxID=451379 RepID=A0A0N5ATQ8_9BILA